jgi:hypothetical protein
LIFTFLYTYLRLDRVLFMKVRVEKTGKVRVGKRRKG